MQRVPKAARAALALLLLLLAALAGNWIYQVVRKPSELLFPVSGSLNKTPAETWREYAPLFNEYSTRVMTPAFLAALAQAEGSGNPLVRTYWRWSWTLHPLNVYRPASSAVGMYQITDGTYAEASRFCIHEHRAIEDRTCGQRGFHALFGTARMVPARAVELTAAYLDRNVALILDRHSKVAAPLPRRQALAAVIHLCGAGAAEAYAKRGFRLSDGQRCGDHDVRGYLARLAALRAEFDRLAVVHPAAGGFAASVRPTSSIADNT